MDNVKEKNIKETELFRKVNILITDKLKQQMNYEKEKATILSNMKIDNSTLIRAMIAYFYDNESQLRKLVPYLKQVEGQVMLEKFKEMLEKDAELEDIQNELGISIDIIRKIDEKYNTEK